MSLVQIHTLRACSLLVIPPPHDRMPMQGGFSTDLSELNLLGWAALVQDVAAGLQVLPPNLGCDMGLPAVALLQLLEMSTGLGFCCYCCHLGSRCTCMGAYQPAPPQLWSQIVEQTPGYGVTASSGGMTTPSTTVAGMSGYVAPPPGLTPPDFSSWRLPPPEAPPSGGLPAASQGLSHMGRSIQVRAMAERQARAQLAQCPRGLVPPAQTQPPAAPCTPQVVLPLCQPPPGWPAMPYQQVVQLPSKSTGRGVASDPSADKTAPTGGPSSQDHGRPTTRGWGDGGRYVSHPRECRRRQVCSCHIRRAICPPGQCQMFLHQQHLKGPCLSREVSLRPPTTIPRDWWQNFTVWGGRRTLSMFSGSTTNTTLPPLRTWSG